MGLDLIDRVPDELWMDVCNTVQEAVIKIIPKKKKWKRENGFLEEFANTWEKKLKAKEKRKDISIWMQSFKE